MNNTGKMVKVAYKGFFDGGDVFIDHTTQPIEFPCIDGWMPPAFIQTVRYMGIGETQTVHVSSDEAYEKHIDERVVEIPREAIPSSTNLSVGAMINLEDPAGKTYPARITALTDAKVVFDLNHDAICKSLNFELTLLEVNDMPPLSSD